VIFIAWGLGAGELKPVTLAGARSSSDRFDATFCFA